MDAGLVREGAETRNRVIKRNANLHSIRNEVLLCIRAARDRRQLGRHREERKEVNAPTSRSMARLYLPLTYSGSTTSVRIDEGQQGTEPTN